MSASLVKSLKTEIARLARKEIKEALVPLREQLGQAHSNITELKLRVDALERAAKRSTPIVAEEPQAVTKRKGRGMAKKGPAAKKSTVAEETAAETKTWISGKGVRRMRSSMRLTLAEFAQLVGVSSKAVSNWEANETVLSLRKSTKESLVSLRGVGAREARRRLEAMATAEPDEQE